MNYTFVIIKSLLISWQISRKILRNCHRFQSEYITLGIAQPLTWNMTGIEGGGYWTWFIYSVYFDTFVKRPKVSDFQAIFFNPRFALYHFSRITKVRMKEILSLAFVYLRMYQTQILVIYVNFVAVRFGI